jgi:hypothetical protein
MNNNYNAILLSEDGEGMVTDFKRETKEEVLDALADMGSRWYFYPVWMVVTSTQWCDAQQRRNKVILECPDEFSEFRYKKVKTLIQHLKDEYSRKNS